MLSAGEVPAQLLSSVAAPNVRNPGFPVVPHRHRTPQIQSGG